MCEKSLPLFLYKFQKHKYEEDTHINITEDMIINNVKGKPLK
jgi:hypothetical protein